MRTYFSIVSQGRSGSTFLERLLDSHPRITCLGEQVGPHGLYAQHRDMDLATFLEERLFGDAQGVLGFKMPWDYMLVFPEVWGAFRTLKFKLVYLRRRNKLDQFLSTKLAIQNDLWSSSAHYDDQSIELDYFEVLNAFVMSLNVDYFLQRMCGEFDHYSVDYEDVVNGAHHAELQDFLGVEYAMLQPGTMRSRAVPRQQAISNFEELAHRFADTPWRHFFVEEEHLATHGVMTAAAEPSIEGTTAPSTGTEPGDDGAASLDQGTDGADHQAAHHDRPPPSPGPVRLLIVGLPYSIHLAKWIGMLADRGWDIHLFPSIDGPPHPALRQVTFYDATGRLDPAAHPNVTLRTLAAPIDRLRRLVHRRTDRAWMLAALIDRLRPTIVHSQEFQHAAYLTIEARRRLGDRFPPWIVSSWGSDIYLFGRVQEHVDQIRAVLADCDYYACECERDVSLARDYGLQGEVLPILPIAGGYDLMALGALRSPGPTSARRTITLKGYMGWAGRALTGLRALELCGSALAGYRLAIYLATPEVAAVAEIVCRDIGIEFDLVGYPAGSAPNEEILRMHGRSRASIGLSISDGISASFLEAILLGSFPIQSDTSCAGDWIDDGVSGILVPPEDPEAVAAALRRAIEDDDLVDRAAAINAETAARRLAMHVIQPQAIAMYEHVAAQGATRRRQRGGTAQ